MAMLDIKSLMHSRIDEMFATISGQASDEDCQFALKRYVQDTYSSLASLAWYCGANGDCLQAEAVPASEIVDDAFFSLNREKEFEVPSYRQPYSTMSHTQQGISR